MNEATKGIQRKLDNEITLGKVVITMQLNEPTFVLLV